jgi:hypothetical protein
MTPLNNLSTGDLELIRTSIKDDYYKKGLEKLKTLKTHGQFKPIHLRSASDLEDYLEAYKQFYQSMYNKAVAAREKLIFDLENQKGSDYKVYDYKNKYYNESLADLVKNVSVKTRILEHQGELIQQINPVFAEPKPKGLLDYRTQFFAPAKYFLELRFETYLLFNIMVIWFSICDLLYYLVF